jgi:hypothetical protein
MLLPVCCLMLFILQVATAEIVAGDRPRALVQRDIKRKESARQTLARKYKCVVVGSRGSDSAAVRAVCRLLYHINAGLLSCSANVWVPAIQAQCR